MVLQTPMLATSKRQLRHYVTSAFALGGLEGRVILSAEQACMRQLVVCLYLVSMKTLCQWPGHCWASTGLSFVSCQIQISLQIDQTDQISLPVGPQLLVTLLTHATRRFY